MFDFVRNLFKKELPKEEIPLEKLSKWFEEKTNPVIDAMNKDIKLGFSEYGVLLNTLKKNIEELEKAEIKEPDKIDNKVKQVVQGNRENYVKRLTQFLSLINMPDEIGYNAAVAFCTNLDKELNDFSQDTIKTYYTVQHLFADQVEKVAKNMKRAGDLIKEIKDITEDKNILEVRKIKEEIQKFKDSRLKKEQLIMRLNEQKTKLEKLEKDKITAQDDIEKLQKSEEYSDYFTMKERINGIENDLSNEKNEIIQLFSPLSAGLKKFERIAINDEDLIKKYSENPVSALLNDKEFKIIKILEDIEKNILSGEIDIRDRKKEKTIEKIKSINYDQLDKIVSRINALRNERDLLLRKIKVNKVWLKNDELKYKLEHIENSLGLYKETSEELRTRIQGIDLVKLKEELESQLKELTKIEVSIKLD